MYNYPEKKKTRLTIPTTRWDVTYLIEQADVETTIDYYSLHKTDETDNIIGLFDIFSKKRAFIWDILVKSEVSPSNKLLRMRRKKLIYNNIHLYIETVVKILFPVRKSLYTNMEHVSNNWNKRNVFSAGDEILAKMTWLPIDELNNRLTMEQKQRRHDKATYDYYETFKKWQEVNSLVRGKMPLTEEEVDLIEHVKKDRARALASKSK